MASPGSLFKTPPGMRMSPGKKRVLYGPAPNLKSVHSALTRVSAALAESRNLHSRMMNAAVAKRRLHARHQTLVNKEFRSQYAMNQLQTKSYPNKEARLRYASREIQKIQKEINAIMSNRRNAERKSNKLVADWEKSKKRYFQLARRVVRINGTRNLNTYPLTHGEIQAVRTIGTFAKNMSAARRTVRHLPLPQNMGMSIVRSMARR